MRRHSEFTKSQARRLRKQGLSIGRISKQLGVPKSTLHLWISDLQRPRHITEQERTEHLKKIRLLASQALRQQRMDRLGKIKEQVTEELKNYPVGDKDFLKSILSMLYWSEGAKGRGLVNFANTDPKLALLFITLLRKCYQIDEDKIRARLHLHYYHNISKTRKFWSSLLGIPEIKFGKIYIKRRSKTKRFRQNFAGICFIKYYSEDLRYEILERGYLLAERIANCVSS